MHMNDMHLGAWIPSNASRRGGARLFAGIIAGTTLMFSAATALAATYEVGPGKPFASLKELEGRLDPGDIVEIQGDAAYPGDIKLSRNGSADAKITIRGIRKNGRRPVLRGGTNRIWLKGDHYVFSGIELTGGSAVCFLHQGDDVTIRDSVIHDCPSHGILGADTESGSLTLEYVEVYKAGSGEPRHPIYVATDEKLFPNAVFRMEQCFVHDGNGGHNVKSRAGRNEIVANWIEGARFHELELIGSAEYKEPVLREDSEVIGNVIRKTNDFPVMRLGSDGTGETKGRYRFLNNTIVLAENTKGVFRLYEGIESVEMHNNVFFKPGGAAISLFRDKEAKWARGHAIIGGSNNWVTAGTDISATWKETLTGTDPGFVDAADLDFTPRPNSPLTDHGNERPTSPAEAPFLRPSGLPTTLPPRDRLEPAGVAEPRDDDGRIDIGAIEAEG